MQRAAVITAAPPDGLKTIRLAILSTFTVDLMKPCLVVEGATRGLLLDLWLAPFGQIEQQAFDPNSLLYQEPRDMVLILPRLEDLIPELIYRFVSHSSEQLAAALENLVGRLKKAVARIREQTGSTVIISNFTAPSWLAAGTVEGSLTFSQSSFIQSLNNALAAACAAIPGTVLFDAARVAVEVGLSRWTDERMTFLAKAPLSLEAMSAFSAAFAKRLCSLHVTPKKCLVLDLDNTLWGGVLGEAGIDGIALGPDYPGNVFVDFQQRILALRDCGILLAVASKNNEADAIQALDQHPACLLHRKDFSAFQVHWEDKATSLRRIAQTLNIGIDALVFFDDNPTERAWIREQMPEVTVIDVPASPLGYAKALAECGCFDLPALVAEDLKRAEVYQQEAVRQEALTQAGSLDDFLKGLDMSLTVGQVDGSTLPRAVQLLGKTNQFNLTTRRHDLQQVQTMLAGGAVALWFRVQDKFGDNGLVGILIAIPGSDTVTWHLDSFLMSCRVIGRRVETAMLAVLEQMLIAQGGKTLTAEFIPTAKNLPAARFLPDHGFNQEGNQWILPLAGARVLPECFRLEGLPPVL